jgi:hypothetical protein
VLENVPPDAAKLSLRNKFLSDDIYDAEFEQKLCGAPEEPNFVYEEGCDDIDVPYKMTKCYCREELCNGATEKTAALAVLAASFVMLLIIG